MLGKKVFAGFVALWASRLNITLTYVYAPRVLLTTHFALAFSCVTIRLFTDHLSGMLAGRVR